MRARIPNSIERGHDSGAECGLLVEQDFLEVLIDKIKVIEGDLPSHDINPFVISRMGAIQSPLAHQVRDYSRHHPGDDSGNENAGYDV